MGVRNCAEIGENLQKIMARLMSNDKLVNLLYYTDKDPLNFETHPILDSDRKKNEIYNNLIKIIPRVSDKDNAQSIIVIRVNSGTAIPENNEFREIDLSIEVFVPITQWMIKDTNLRPFAILGQIQESLQNKTINGLGKLQGGDFELAFITEEVSCYTTHYSLINYV